MDGATMRSRFEGLLQDANWGDGVSKQDIVGMVQRDDALHTLIEQYLPDERFTSMDAVLTRIPVQAWQDTQGDDWRGAESEEASASASHFSESATARDE